MDNRDVARLLVQTADLMEIAAEDPFRIRSYRNAATAIEACPESVLEILQDPARKVTDLPGIGKGMAANLHEIAVRGSFERRDQLLERYPPTALELLNQHHRMDGHFTRGRKMRHAPCGESFENRPRLSDPGGWQRNRDHG